MNVNKTKKGTDTRFSVPNIILVAATIAAVLLIGTAAGVERMTSPDRFVEGIRIGGTDVSGLGYEEAEAAVLAEAENVLSSIELPVTFEGESIVLNADDLGISTNAKEVLDRAFYYNKQTEDTLGQKFDKGILEAGQDFDIDILVDEGKLRGSLEKFAADSEILPVDAQAGFDKADRTFTYTREKDGRMIDVEAAVQEICGRIQKQDYSAYVCGTKTLLPGITRDALKENTVSIALCQTQATSDENRNTNIRLMCQAIDGYVIEPGGVLSINGLVGERTAEKGFKRAPAIIDGTKLSDEFGGGICQVSGTLYNAALAADMEIVERVHHTWPSSYLPVGLDSTLNWDDKDLKIKNKSGYPVYISATFKDRQVRVEIFGAPLPKGMTVEIENNILKKIDPPSADIIYTNALPVGTRQTQVYAREGYEVEVNRNYVMDGQVVDSESISKDYYPAIKGVILEGVAAQEK